MAAHASSLEYSWAPTACRLRTCSNSSDDWRPPVADVWTISAWVDLLLVQRAAGADPTRNDTEQDETVRIRIWRALSAGGGCTWRLAIPPQACRETGKDAQEQVSGMASAAWIACT